MPKLKTRRGAAKRFTFTAKGKVKRHKGFKRHILSSKTRKQKRHLRRAGLVNPADEKSIKRLLPYGC
ncbi:MAG TPA: 50S ribosomal protein L35 [Candidatus Eisenbacteria bacterium]|nr:50S ribosomal protein L35 [Candidatus Eisenbacteria bacterium]